MPLCPPNVCIGLPLCGIYSEQYVLRPNAAIASH